MKERKTRRWRPIAEGKDPFSWINETMISVSLKSAFEEMDPFSENKLQAYEDVVLHPERHMKGTS